LRIEPARLKSLKLGVFGQTPPADWLLRHHLLEQAVPYQPQTGDPETYPGETIEKDLASGAIDVAFLWGPIAGFLAKSSPLGIVVVPFPPERDLQMDFRIAMGVRFGERAWKDKVDGLIAANLGRIHEILAGYGVPLLDDEGRLIAK
jgi:ABC-type amino acid transport substrate-binding protein